MLLFEDLCATDFKDVKAPKIPTGILSFLPCTKSLLAPSLMSSAFSLGICYPKEGTKNATEIKKIFLDLPVQEFGTLQPP